jgi:hypothetical protein
LQSTLISAPPAKRIEKVKAKKPVASKVTLKKRQREDDEDGDEVDALASSTGPPPSRRFRYFDEQDSSEVASPVRAMKKLSVRGQQRDDDAESYVSSPESMRR